MTSRPPAVARVLERLVGDAREHGMFGPGDTVLVMVSGGPDSICLLSAMHRVRRLLKVRLCALHVDHRLRERSERDAAYVRAVATRLRIPFEVHTVTERPSPGDSVEAWARAVRYRAAHDAARELDARRIALAHTMDDQAETVLLAVLTGRGLDAVAGMKPVAGPFVRPLLGVSRDEVEAFCRSLHLRPRRDPTNEDRRFLRNALRLDGIPALEADLGRPVREPVAQTAALLRDDADELSRRALAVFDDVAWETAEGADLHPGRLRTLPRAVAGRVVRLMLLRLGVVATREDVVAVLDLAAGRVGRTRDLSAGLKARRDKEYLSLSRTSPESRV